MDRHTSRVDYVETTIRRGDQVIQRLGRRGGGLDHVARLKSRSVRVNYFCPGGPMQLQRLFAAGVEFPLVDRVDEMLEAAEDVGIERLPPRFRKPEQRLGSPRLLFPMNYDSKCEAAPCGHCN